MVATSEIRNPVAPPEVRPRLHGLTTTFQPRDLESHERLGVTWPGSGACGGIVSTTDDECLSGESQTALTLVDACLERGTARRHTVYSFVRQSLLDSLDDNAAYSTDPESIFAHAEAPSVEALFWTDAYAAAVALPAPDSLLEALAEVEQYLAENYNGTGVIHITARVAILLGDDGLVRPSGTLTTRTGTPVVIGAGYDGDDGLTIIGTGQPVLYRADNPQKLDGTSSSNNNHATLLQRTWLIGWDCVAVRATYTPAP